MTTNQPSQEEVEAVATAMFRSEHYSQPRIVWEGLSPFAREQYRLYARAAIAELDRLHSAPASAWRPIGAAKKNRSVIWALIYADLSTRTNRPDLERWNGLQVPLCHPGLADDGFDTGWNIAAPVGHGGFPDEWISGWVPLLAPPPATSDAGHRQVGDEKESGS